MRSRELYVKKIARISKEVDKVSISFRFKSIDKFKELDKDSNYYNNDRYQWNLKSPTPVEYRNQAA
ncbi:IS3 family transposase [Ligilactobacillus salivarius]|uniref:IS3 family transposase n=1 Tax=Ligilactobacillus salivarius TaxID=1624 RepID=UPI0038640AE4